MRYSLQLKKFVIFSFLLLFVFRCVSNKTDKINRTLLAGLIENLKTTDNFSDNKDTNEIVQTAPTHLKTTQTSDTINYFVLEKN